MPEASPAVSTARTWLKSATGSGRRGLADRLTSVDNRRVRYRRFGNTGLFASELCLGTMTFGGRGFWEAIGKLGAADVETMIGTALDAGVNLIDTADVYSEGESERLVGTALAALGRPRDQYLVAHEGARSHRTGPERCGALARTHSRLD